MVQYNELAGIQDNELPGGGGTGNPAYTAALSMLDTDMAQYVHDNTDDEFTHQNFLNSYLISKAADPVSLEQFRTLGSSATGSTGAPRLTNLMQLTLDTSWWTRYRDSTHNQFPERMMTPRTPTFCRPLRTPPASISPRLSKAETAFITSMAQRATSVEVLRILISIGPTETMHFQTWSDKAGNALPLTAVDPVTGVSVTFPDLNSPPFGGEEFQTNLIMPGPCPFLSRKLPPCSIIRPTETKGVAMNVLNFLTAMGLFIGQPPAFFTLLKDLAEDADEARRGH